MTMLSKVSCYQIFSLQLLIWDLIEVQSLSQQVCPGRRWCLSGSGGANLGSLSCYSPSYRSVFEKPWCEIVLYYQIYNYYHSQIIVYTIMFYSFTITVLGIAATISSKNIIRNSVRTELSELVELSCSSSSPWFFCVWEGPRGDRVCSLRSNIHQGGGTMCGVSEKLKMKGKIVTPKI